MFNFLIVGNGLAAYTMAHRFLEEGISFKVIGNSNLSKSSRVAAGIWNPVVFKRMTKSWLADELIPELLSFYRAAEKRLNIKFVAERNIIKPFFSEEEKQFWHKKSKEHLSGFLSSEIHDNKQELKNLIVPNTYGVVKHCGNIDLDTFLTETENYLRQHQLIENESFSYAELEIKNDHLLYKSIPAKHILFCEGFQVVKNPFFSWLPLKPVKGEVLEIQSHDLDLKHDIFNRDGFVLPLGNNRYKIGATYNWSDLSENPTEEGRHELMEKLKKITTAGYNIMKHEAGIRPSSADRRPIIGAHPEHKHMFVFNGLGTKGVMLAPYVTKNFVNFFLNNTLLHPETDVARFYKHYQK